MPTGNWTVGSRTLDGGERGTLSWFEVGRLRLGRLRRNDIYHYTDEFLAMTALAGRGRPRDARRHNGGIDWIDAAAVTGNFALNLGAGASHGQRRRPGSRSPAAPRSRTR